MRGRDRDGQMDCAGTAGTPALARRGEQTMDARRRIGWLAGAVRSGVAVGILVASNAGAWMPIAHYCIAKEAAQTTANVPAGVERYAGLPDYHENTDLIYLKMRVENTPEFCWSHGVISHDYSGDITLTFPNDGRDPEDVLYSLLRYKLASARFADPVVKLAAPALGSHLRHRQFCPHWGHTYAIDSSDPAEARLSMA